MIHNICALKHFIDQMKGMLNNHFHITLRDFIRLMRSPPPDTSVVANCLDIPLFESHLHYKYVYLTLHDAPK